MVIYPLSITPEARRLAQRITPDPQIPRAVGRECYCLDGQRIVVSTRHHQLRLKALTVHGRTTTFADMGCYHTEIGQYADLLCALALYHKHPEISMGLNVYRVDLTTHRSKKEKS